jgi:hypothetical protein
MLNVLEADAAEVVELDVAGDIVAELDVALLVVVI